MTSGSAFSLTSSERCDCEKTVSFNRREEMLHESLRNMERFRSIDSATSMAFSIESVIFLFQTF